jgi:hypothetical protein
MEFSRDYPCGTILHPILRQLTNTCFILHILCSKHRDFLELCYGNPYGILHAPQKQIQSYLCPLTYGGLSHSGV